MERSPDEDAALVRAARAGEEDAFRALFEKYKERALGVASRYARNREDALDVVQNAFIKAFKRLDDFRGESHFSHWFFRIVANAAIDAARQRKEPQASYDEARESEGVSVRDDHPERDPARAAEDSELRQAYQQALGELSPDHREVFALHITQGLQYREIAQTLDIPIGTVMSRLHYARKHLQKTLRRFLADENTR